MDKRLVLFRWWVTFTLLMGLVGSAGMVRAAAPSVTRLDDMRVSQLATVDVCILATGQIGHVSRLQLLGDVTGILFGDVDDEACSPEPAASGDGQPGGASGTDGTGGPGNTTTPAPVYVDVCVLANGQIGSILQANVAADVAGVLFAPVGDSRCAAPAETNAGGGSAAGDPAVNGGGGGGGGDPAPVYVDVCVLATGTIGSITQAELDADVTGVLFGDITDQTCAPGRTTSENPEGSGDAAAADQQGAATTSSLLPGLGDGLTVDLCILGVLTPVLAALVDAQIALGAVLPVNGACPVADDTGDDAADGSADDTADGTSDDGTDDGGAVVNLCILGVLTPVLDILVDAEIALGATFPVNGACPAADDGTDDAADDDSADDGADDAADDGGDDGEPVTIGVCLVGSTEVFQVVEADAQLQLAAGEFIRVGEGICGAAIDDSGDDTNDGPFVDLCVLGVLTPVLEALVDIQLNLGATFPINGACPGTDDTADDAADDTDDGTADDAGDDGADGSADDGGTFVNLCVLGVLTPVLDILVDAQIALGATFPANGACPARGGRRWG